jgi:hypothetical protein
MKGELALRTLIRSLLTEKGNIDPVRKSSISNLYYPNDVQMRKILIISPGIDDAYEWKGDKAAPHHFKQAVPRLDDDVAIVVAENANTSIDSVLRDIAKDETLSKVSRIDLLGFSGGGNTVLRFMKSSPNSSRISKFYLADPHWGDEKTATVPFPGKTVLMHNVGNWSASYNMGPKFKVMHKSVVDGGGTAIETKLSHVDILRDMISRANS